LLYGSLLILETLAHRPPDHPTRAEIKNHGEIEPSFKRVDICYVAGPHAVFAADLLQAEAAVQEFVGYGKFVLGIGGPTEASAQSDFRFRLPPNSRHALSSHALSSEKRSFTAQLSMDMMCAVGLRTYGVGHADACQSISSLRARSNGVLSRQA
jgi:hypothetical protein